MGEVGQVLRGGGLGWGLVLVTVASQASRDPVAGVGVSRRRWGWVGMYREHENSSLEWPDHTPLQSSSSELAEKLSPGL